MSTSIEQAFVKHFQADVHMAYLLERSERETRARLGLIRDSAALRTTFRRT